MCCDNDEKHVLQPARIRFPLEPYGEDEERCVGLIVGRAGCRREAPLTATDKLQQQPRHASRKVNLSLSIGRHVFRHATPFGQ